MTNREIMFNRLTDDLNAALELNKVESVIHIDSLISGFQMLAYHFELLIRNMEKEGSTAQEIIQEMKKQLDNGPQQPFLN